MAQRPLLSTAANKKVSKMNILWPRTLIPYKNKMLDIQWITCHAENNQPGNAFVCFLIKSWLLSYTEQPTATCWAGCHITECLTGAACNITFKQNSIFKITEGQVAPESCNVSICILSRFCFQKKKQFICDLGVWLCRMLLPPTLPL